MRPLLSAAFDSPRHRLTPGPDPTGAEKENREAADARRAPLADPLLDYFKTVDKITDDHLNVLFPRHVLVETQAEVRVIAIILFIFILSSFLLIGARIMQNKVMFVVTLVHYIP